MQEVEQRKEWLPRTPEQCPTKHFSDLFLAPESDYLQDVGYAGAASSSTKQIQLKYIAMDAGAAFLTINANSFSNDVRERTTTKLPQFPESTPKTRSSLVTILPARAW